MTKKAKFRDKEIAEKYSVPYDELGEVAAMETRDKEAFLVVRFSAVEVNGLPADLFEIIDDDDHY